MDATNEKETNDQTIGQQPQQLGSNTTFIVKLLQENND